MSGSDIFLGLIAILFPPIAVWIKSGLCSCDSCINILLCLLGYLPGLIHAWYIIAKYPEHEYDRVEDTERHGRGQVTYYYITHETTGRQERRYQRSRGYGTAAPAIKASPNLHQNFQYQSNQGPPPQQFAGVENNNAPSGSRPGPSNNAGPANQGAPPSYSEAVRGDHKIQTRD